MKLDDERISGTKELLFNNIQINRKSRECNVKAEIQKTWLES